MEFFMSVMKEVFSKQEALKRVLGGESVASATGCEV
jgi:hypothetical protein